MKRTVSLLLTCALGLSLLSGCAKDGEGLALSVCTGAAPESLDPIYAEDVGGQTILAHLYENLMRVTADSTGKTSVLPGMAKSVDQEEETKDGAVTVTYTFRLRSARWSDGQSVTAGDFVYAWQRLANPATGSRYADLLSVVKGYQEARATKDMSLLQVTAKNDSTLVVVLNGHYDWFLKEVCTSPATMPLRQDVVQRLKASSGDQSWWEGDPTQLVTNGPYTVAALEEGRSLQLAANSRYYAAQPGPQSVAFHFAGSAEEAWSLYEAKTVDAVWPLPDARLTELAEDPEWAPLPELATYAALFNCASDLFSDPAIREAMSLAIDRSALAQAAGDQRGDAHRGAHRHRDHQVLHREGQGHRVQGVLAELGHKVAVHHVVQRLHQHGQDHGDRHVQQQLVLWHDPHLVFFASLRHQNSSSVKNSGIPSPEGENTILFSLFFIQEPIIVESNFNVNHLFAEIKIPSGHKISP